MLIRFHTNSTCKKYGLMKHSNTRNDQRVETTFTLQKFEETFNLRQDIVKGCQRLILNIPCSIGIFNFIKFEAFSNLMQLSNASETTGKLQHICLTHSLHHDNHKKYESIQQKPLQRTYSHARKGNERMRISFFHTHLN